MMYCVYVKITNVNTCTIFTCICIKKTCTPWSKTMIYPSQSTTGSFQTIKKHMISESTIWQPKQTFGPSHPILQMRLYHYPYHPCMVHIFTSIYLILCGIYIHTRIIDPLDDYWLNTCPIGTPISKCISINQYRYRYRDIDIHRLRHYMIIHGVRLFSKTPPRHTHLGLPSPQISRFGTCLVWVPIHVLVRYSKLTSCAGQKRKVKRSAQPTEQEVHTASCQHFTEIPGLSDFFSNKTYQQIMESYNLIGTQLYPFIPGGETPSFHHVILQSFSKKNKLHYVGVPVTSSKENSDAPQTKRTKTAHWMSRKKVGQQFFGSDTCGNIFC